MAKSIIYIGIIVVLIGIFLFYFPNAFKWFGKLPGDIRIERENSKFFFPITTMILITVLLNIVLRIFKNFG